MNDHDSLIMDGLALERMLYAIEGSLKVTRRVQFFLWSQGALQGLMPHETLICVFGDFLNNRFKYDVFSRNKLNQIAVDHITDPVDGLLPRVIQDWRLGDCTPRIYDTEAISTLHVDIQRLGWGRAAAHGAKEIQGSEGSFYILLGMPKVEHNWQRYQFDLILPHMHMALYRMLQNERDSGLVEVSPESVLSTREIEVLRWVREGKTNQQIGQQLNISPLTVKNHVQKILRKLRVSNRAQAVAKGQTSRIFSGSSGNNFQRHNEIISVE